MRILIVYNVASVLTVGVSRDLVCEAEMSIIVPLVREVLTSAGHQVSVLECDWAFWETLKRSRHDFDLVLNLAEGFGGTNSGEPLVPAMLEALDVPFTGASSANMYLTLDKEKTKYVALACGVPCLPHEIIRGTNPNAEIRRFGFPVIAKPIRQEASVGIYLDNVVLDSGALNEKIRHMLKAYRQPVLLEPFVVGREISVGLLGNGDEVVAFPPLEFLFPDAAVPTQAFRSYEYKWGGRKEVMVRAELPAQTEHDLLRYSLEMFKATECRDYARIDFLISDSGAVYFLEVNYNPGIGPNTHGLNNTLTMMAGFAGIEFEELIVRLVDVAHRRTASHPSWTC
jgi:D-alanine-D-alanine ligase